MPKENLRNLIGKWLRNDPTTRVDGRLSRTRSKRSEEIADLCIRTGSTGPDNQFSRQPRSRMFREARTKLQLSGLAQPD